VREKEIEREKERKRKRERQIEKGREGESDRVGVVTEQIGRVHFAGVHIPRLVAQVVPGQAHFRVSTGSNGAVSRQLLTRDVCPTRVLTRDVCPTR
jgi:hypothetical protein